jgi:hypothetical protein
LGRKPAANSCPGAMISDLEAVCPSPALFGRTVDYSPHYLWNFPPGSVPTIKAARPRAFIFLPQCKERRPHDRLAQCINDRAREGSAHRRPLRRSYHPRLWIEASSRPVPPPPSSALMIVVIIMGPSCRTCAARKWFLADLHRAFISRITSFSIGKSQQREERKIVLFICTQCCADHRTSSPTMR